MDRADRAGAPVALRPALHVVTEGTQRLAASYARSTARHVGGAPTLFIGATRYSGRYQKRALLAAICAVMPGKKPTACAP